MQINIKVLVDFLNRVKLSGSVELQDVILNFKKDGLHVVALSQFDGVLVRGFLKAQNFKDYIILGELGIKNFPRFFAMLTTFDEEISLVVVKNALVIANKYRKIQFSLAATDFITKVTDDIETQLFKTVSEEIITLEKQVVQDIISDIILISASSFLLRGQNKKIGIKVTEADVVSDTVGISLVREINIARKIKAFELKVPIFFVEALKNLNTDIEVSFENNKPIYIKCVGLKFIVEYIITTISES